MININSNFRYPIPEEYDTIVNAIINLLRIPKSKENLVTKVKYLLIIIVHFVLDEMAWSRADKIQERTTTEHKQQRNSGVQNQVLLFDIRSSCQKEKPWSCWQRSPETSMMRLYL